jgi:hypothetical protein
MNFDDILRIVEKKLLHRNLSPSEKLVLAQSYDHQTYGVMAQETGYSGTYLKDVGRQLWQELSESLEQRVTKKSLPFILQRYLLTNKVVPSPPNPPSPNPIEQTPTQFPYFSAKNYLEYPSGTVALNSPFYIERPPYDHQAQREIERPGSLVRLKAPRKMGKSSLLLRIMAHAIEQNYQIVDVDLKVADQAVFSSIETFVHWFCTTVAQELELDSKLEAYWQPVMGCKVSCELYFRRYILQQINTPLLLVINELDQLFEYAQIAQDFLPMLRSWHEKAKRDQIWENLRLVIVHSTEIYVPLALHQSPFNIGCPVTLPYFTSEQVLTLAQRYGLKECSADHIQQIINLVGGHPFLVNVAFYHLSRQDITLEYFLKTAPTPAGIYKDHLRSYLAILQKQPQLATAMRRVVSCDHEVELDAITAYQLESLGLVTINQHTVVPAFDLYRSYYRQQLNL